MVSIREVGMTCTRIFMILLISVFLFPGCQATDTDPFVKEWQRRKRLIIKEKELYPIKGVPEKVEWHMPRSIVVAGERLEVVLENRRYNLIDEKGVLKRRISINVWEESSHAVLVDSNAWSKANSTSAPHDDEELIKHVRVYHSGNYIIFPGVLSAEVLYSNVSIRVYCENKYYTEDFDAVEVAKAILEAGLIK